MNLKFTIENVASFVLSKWWLMEIDTNIIVVDNGVACSQDFVPGCVHFFSSDA